MGSTTATAETSNAFYQGAPPLESTKVFLIFLLLFFVATNCWVSEEENALGLHVQVNSNRVHEFVQDVSSMPGNNPSPNFCTKVIVEIN
jgi:hypothetical protein